jgi:hypothetical protein
MEQSEDMKLLRSKLVNFKKFVCEAIIKEGKQEEEKEFISWINKLDETKDKDMKNFFTFIDYDISPLFIKYGDKTDLIKSSIKSVLINRSGIKDPKIYNKEQEQTIYEYFEMFNEINTAINY